MFGGGLSIFCFYGYTDHCTGIILSRIGKVYFDLAQVSHSSLLSHDHLVLTRSADQAAPVDL